MSYVDESLVGCLARRSNAHDTAEDLTAANAVYGGYIVLKQCKIKRIMFVVTTAISASGTVKVEFNRRPTIGSASGEVQIGELTLPTGTAAGKVVYKDVDPVVLYPGEELSLEQTGLASSAGAGFYGFELMDDPEAAGNQSNMLASV